jgi:hypothetical protein
MKEGAIMRKAIAVAALALAGCASVPEGPEPRIDAQGHDPVKVQQDMRNCKLFARDVSNGPGPNWGKVIAAVNVGLGYGLGAAISPAGGVMGGTMMGTAMGSVPDLPDPDGPLPTYDTVLRDCITQRGYKLLS